MYFIDEGTWGKNLMRDMFYPNTLDTNAYIGYDQVVTQMGGAVDAIQVLGGTTLQEDGGEEQHSRMYTFRSGDPH